MSTSMLLFTASSFQVISVLGCHHLARVELHCRRLEALRLSPLPGRWAAVR